MKNIFISLLLPLALIITALLIPAFVGIQGMFGEKSIISGLLVILLSLIPFFLFIMAGLFEDIKNRGYEKHDMSTE